MFGRRPKHMDPDGGAERDEAIGQSPLAPYFLMMIEPDQVVQLHEQLAEQALRTGRAEQRADGNSLQLLHGSVTRPGSFPFVREDNDPSR